MKRINVYLPDVTLVRLRDEAKRKGISLAEVIRRALDAYKTPEA